jgi:capsular polysaccharide biosynthesis protein
LLVENARSEDDILAFGEDEETEQLLQILHSNRIRGRIIEKYDLMNHYQIGKKSQYRLTKLYREYENNITFRRTEFMAIKISVLDTDPQIAADIANSIASLLDSTKNQMQKERAVKAYEIVKAQYLKLMNEVAEMEDSLTILREFGVHDYESQSEMINRQLAIELAKGNTSAVKRLEGKLKILAKYGGPYVSLRDALEYEKKQLSMIKAKYEEAKTDAEEILPTKFVVNYAYKAERKSYPIRWLIVVVTAFSALLLTLILILILENLQHYLPLSKNVLDALKTSPQYFNKGKLPEDKEKPEPPGEPPQRAQANPVMPPRPLRQEIKNQKKEKKEPERKEEKKEPENNQQLNETIKTETTEKRENQMERYFANTNFLKLLFKWKIHLVVITLLAVILAAIFSGPTFITPMFKSYALVYPSNVQSYSEESESEQMLQYFQSREIRDKIIEKYNLAKRYKIDPSYKYFQTAMLGEYSKNISISKTPYESVRIDVMDSDPQIACDIVNDIIVFYNQKVLKTHRAKYQEIVVILADRLEKKRQEIDEVEKKHYELRNVYGLIDYPNQSREVARGFLGTVDGTMHNTLIKRRY